MVELLTNPANYASTVAAVASIVCALIASKNGKRAEKAEKDAKAYRTDRERLDKAKSRVLIATMEGVQVLLLNAKGEKMNGNVTVALEELRNAERELENVRGDILARV